MNLTDEQSAALETARAVLGAAEVLTPGEPAASGNDWAWRDEALAVIRLIVDAFAKETS